MGIKKVSLRMEKLDVSFMIRIINALSLGSKKVSVTFLLRNIIVTSFIIKKQEARGSAFARHKL